MTVVIHDDPKLLAEATAARLIVRLTDAQAERGFASLVLTGGRIAAQIYAAVLANPARDAVDWSRVDFWWGDERFLPSGDPDRNETQARAALLDGLPVDPARVHPMPASDGPLGDDAPAAAASYARELAASAGASGGVVGGGAAGLGAAGAAAAAAGAPGLAAAGMAAVDAAAVGSIEPAGAAESGGAAGLPRFDVVLLGVGEDGHVASVFPGHPVIDETGTTASVHDSPKPPPVRVTLTLPAINTAAEVWLIAAGDGKADAVREAHTATPAALPAARVRGEHRTLWLLDRAAAASLPA
ncbi:6-phosphogluconolactonase [Dactylosporangium sp. CA-152071]|uniref:6-phosphogluconolactonase n=1 Tax=Dactylosporangium sp. CA-152071 TaxID=3239933 RepID=UPI003D94C914